jgi:hypothetical protein
MDDGAHACEQGQEHRLHNETPQRLVSRLSAPILRTKRIDDREPLPVGVGLVQLDEVAACDPS